MATLTQTVVRLSVKDDIFNSVFIPFYEGPSILDVTLFRKEVSRLLAYLYSLISDKQVLSIKVLSDVI